jgi:hypothetical protein
MILSGTYTGGIAIVICFIAAIFIVTTLLDLYFVVTNAPPVGYRVQRWARQNPLLAAALLLIYAMLATHFLANKLMT